MTDYGPFFMSSILPLLLLAGEIVLIVLAIRYFIRLGSDVRAIRKILEENSSK